jgi:hypothetical protein
MKRRTFGAGLAVVIAAGGVTMAVAPAGASGATAAAPTTTTTTTSQYEIKTLADGTLVQSQREVPVTVGVGPADYTKPAPPARPAPERLDPTLAAAAHGANPGAKQQVIVTFTEDTKLPRFPDLDPDQPRTASVNVAAQARADSLVGNLRTGRRPGYQAASAELAKLGVRTLDTFWLFKGMLVEAPAAALPAIAARPDVAYVSPAVVKATPPVDDDRGNDEWWARRIMGTDPFFDLGQTSGYIGVLDTGVRATHTLLNPQRAWIREDMTGGNNPDDTCGNHGTSTVAAITGNTNLGDGFGDGLRGLTAITTDSFKVYGCDVAGNTTLNADWVRQGFERAVQVLDRVIVAEMQVQESETGPIATAADAAFDAGAVVVGANGNFGQAADGTPVTASVRSPALAHKVLGIGANDLSATILVTQPTQSRGPAPDGRIKPDLQAPTGAETASNASDTATRVFTGTSGATANAAGAIALARNYLRTRGATVFEIDPGQVYAYMIANGSLLGSTINNLNGAGGIRLPHPPDNTIRSQVSISANQTLSIPFAVGQGTNADLKVAIWWPERPTAHNDIDLQLVDPNGFVRDSSITVSSVFEKVGVHGVLTPGTWTLRIRGYSVPTGSQLVNYAASLVGFA